MTLAAGSRLGPYEVMSALGVGGMGEVYRARDTRLDRTVAIKVLPSHLSQSPEFRQRFEREAKTISSLSHPHICALYDVGQAVLEEDRRPAPGAGRQISYIVMEYLKGETLTDRLAKGPLATEQVLRHAIEIADALDKAHRQGIVHRDLKPGNVMLTKSGVKLVDFGLAKFSASAPITPGLSLLPTQEGANLTAEGTILGTFQYMAPEQLEGKEADARTDIFAFGAVLYEMATGQKAFSGKSQASLIASIIGSDPPPISSVQPMTPPALDRVVKTCLAKDPEDRWQTAHDVMLQLKWIAEGGSQAGIPAPLAARRRGRERLAWVVNALTAILAVAATLVVLQIRREPSRVIQSSINPPEKSRFSFEDGPMALSPDGRRLAFVARAPEGKKLLWVRPLDALLAQPLAGTEGASFHFWSADSRFLGFFADGKLKRIDASGGSPETLCDAPQGRGGTWSRDGVILFAPTVGGPIYRVSSSGGSATPVTRVDPSRRETSHRWPCFLPDGRHFLYLVQGEKGGLHVGSLDSKEEKLLLLANSNVAYAPPGYILFFRERTLRAQPFDAKRLQLTGEAFPLAEQVQSNAAFANANFSVSENGVLAYLGGAANLSQLVWLDRSGKRLGSVGEPADYWDPRISHDGRRIAYVINDAAGNGDIWLYDVSRRVATRFTFDPENDYAPVWSPDDSRIVFTSYRKGPGDLYQKVSTGAGSDELLLGSSSRKIPSGWSPDGRFLALHLLQPKTSWDILVFSLGDRKLIPYLQTEFAEYGAQFSPDGRWVAYVSAESGRPEIYVQPFPGPGGKWQISTAGGSMPAWRRDGKELFYIAPDSKLMVARVRTGSTFEAEVPESLFESRQKSFGGLTRRQYDVSPDGQRFLVNWAMEEESSTPITLVQNWTAKARR